MSLTSVTSPEPVTHPGRTDAHKHLQELGAINSDEGDVGLSGGGFSQQGLPGPRRSGQHSTLRPDQTRRHSKGPIMLQVPSFWCLLKT